MAKVKETIHDDEELISFYQEQVIRVVRKCKKVRWLKLIYTSQPPCYGVWICKKNVLRRTEREGKET